MSALRRLIGLSVVATLSLHARPALAAAGTEAAAFLDIPVGAEPAAMGAAYSALAKDAYASVYNPAGLALVESPQLAGQHLSYLDSLHYEYAGVAWPLKKTRFALGGSIQYLGTGDVAGLEQDGLTAREYSSYYAAYNLSAGYALSNRLSLGLTGKMINAKLDTTSANAFAVDLGSLYHWRKEWSFAATLMNVGSKLKFEDQGDPLPLALHVGAAYQPNARWLASSEINYFRSGLASFRLGGQWMPMELLALRAGYRTDSLKELSALAGMSMGLGVYLWGQEFAYAWVPYGDLGDTHYISLMLKWKNREEDRRGLIQYKQIKPHRRAQERGGSRDDVEYQQIMEMIREQDPKVVEKESKKENLKRKGRN